MCFLSCPRKSLSFQERSLVSVSFYSRYLAVQWPEVRETDKKRKKEWQGKWYLFVVLLQWLLSCWVNTPSPTPSSGKDDADQAFSFIHKLSRVLDLTWLDGRRVKRDVDVEEVHHHLRPLSLLVYRLNDHLLLLPHLLFFLYRLFEAVMQRQNKRSFLSFSLWWKQKTYTCTWSLQMRMVIYKSNCHSKWKGYRVNAIMRWRKTWRNESFLCWCHSSQDARVLGIKARSGYIFPSLALLSDWEEDLEKMRKREWIHETEIQSRTKESVVTSCTHEDRKWIPFRDKSYFGNGWPSGWNRVVNIQEMFPLKSCRILSGHSMDKWKS